MQTQTQSPWAWLDHVSHALQWPVIVVFAFGLGRYVKGLETRIAKAESYLTALMERHLPHIHNALAEIKGLLQGRR